MGKFFKQLVATAKKAQRKISARIATYSELPGKIQPVLDTSKYVHHEKLKSVIYVNNKGELREQNRLYCASIAGIYEYSDKEKKEYNLPTDCICIDLAVNKTDFQE